VKPLSYYEQIIWMKGKADKLDLRLRWNVQGNIGSPFERLVEGFGAKHKRIPSQAWSYNSNVDTVIMEHQDLIITMLCRENGDQEVLQVVAFQNLLFGRFRHSIFQNVRDLLKQTCEIDRLGDIVFNAKSRSCFYIIHPAECCYHYYRSIF